MKFPTFLLFLALGSLCLQTVAADDLARASLPPADSALHATILELDTRLFSAFNAADLDAARQLFAPDVEFYHDKDGLANYAQTMSSLERLFKQTVRPQRTLIPATGEVYPIKGFGAVHLGSHRFCVVENGETHCSVYKFVHLWRLRDGQWQLVRVVSVGH